MKVTFDELCAAGDVGSPFALESIWRSSGASLTARALPPTDEAVVAHSAYQAPIDMSPGRLAGKSRRWGDADAGIQKEVVAEILRRSRDQPAEDRAALLATAWIESGFNPDAAARSSSARGVFQLLDSTSRAFGITPDEAFDLSRNVDAALKLRAEHAALIARRHRGITSERRTLLLYALHHDGPALRHGGLKIAELKLKPLLPRFRAFVGCVEGHGA